MFTREQIVVRSKFVYKFSLTLMKLKVSSFQDLYEVDLFLVTTCWIYEKYELKNFEVCSKHWHFNAIEFQIMLDGQMYNFCEEISHRYKCSFHSKFVIINTET